MSFWGDRIAETRPTPPAPRTPQAVAPGAWWQQGTQHEQPQQAVAPVPPPGYAADPVPYQSPQGYAPETAQHLRGEDLCPRCDSPEFAEIKVNTEFGGARPELAAMGGKIKQCFSCRYPWPDASGEIDGGRGMGGLSSANVSNVDSKRVRHFGNPRAGSWNSSSWENAPLITPKVASN